MLVCTALVDPKLVGMLFHFDSVDNVEEGHTGVGSSSKWLVSHVDTRNMTCSYFDGLSIPLNEFIFSRLKLQLPFNGFDEVVLMHLKISFSKLCLITCSFVKVYYYW